MTSMTSMTSWWETMPIWRRVNKTRLVLSKKFRAFSFRFFCLFSHFPILFQFLLFFLFSAEMSDQPGARCSAAYRRAADPEMDDPGGESEMHRNALSQSIPIYPCRPCQPCLVKASCDLCVLISWCQAKWCRQCCRYMSIYVNMGMMKCKCKYNMFCTSYKTLINVLYLLGITTECVELPLVWTMPFTWTFLRFSISTWTRLTRQWFCEYRSRTFIVLIWICYKDIVAQCRAGTKQLCDPTRIVNYCLLF